ncbi:hypothetical protein ACFZBU_25725 [Embleya sp. NPDC008237]|uniref:hypothetical protein n=1 Tax=Embleya sp. NPDC008237 TaxID=3363978 RepID=UPI0036E8DEDE
MDVGAAAHTDETIHAGSSRRPTGTDRGGAGVGGGVPAVGTAASALVPFVPADLPDVLDFLVRADLTLSGLDAAEVRLWLLRDGGGRVCGSAG